MFTEKEVRQMISESVRQAISEAQEVEYNWDKQKQQYMIYAIENAFTALPGEVAKRYSAMSHDTLQTNVPRTQSQVHWKHISDMLIHDVRELTKTYTAIVKNKLA